MIKALSRSWSANWLTRSLVRGKKLMKGHSTDRQHYDENYFKWQKSAADFGRWANLTKFERYVQPDFNVIDFGCGPGYLLRNLECKARIGIDINDASRAEAAAHGLEVHRTSPPFPIHGRTSSSPTTPWSTVSVR
jgi:SAM-dependent methyltransferase